MNCSNCGTPLVPGNNTCPACGALNMPLPQAPVQPNPPEVAVENVNNVNQVAATTEAPSLAVNEEVLEENVESLEEAAKNETYETLEVPAEKQEQPKDINLQIPAASDVQQVAVDQNVQAGGVGEVATTQNTAGSEELVSNAKFKSVKIGKFNLKLGNIKLRDVVLYAVFLIFGLFLGYMLFTNKTTTTCKKVVTEKVQKVADGKNNVTYVNGYTYKIPNSFTYDKYDNGLVVYEKNYLYKIYIKTDILDYNNIANSKISIQQTLIDSSYGVDDIKEVVINKHSYLIIQARKNGVNETIAYTSAGNNKVFYIEIIMDDNNYNTDPLTVADDIVYNAESGDLKAQLEKTDVFDLTKLINSTVEYNTSINN